MKDMENNKSLSKIFREIYEMLEIGGAASVWRLRAYRRTADFLDNFSEDVSVIYKKGGLKGLEKLPIIGKSIAKKIEEFLKSGKIKYYQELKDKTAIQQIIAHFFKSKGLSLDELKENARKRKIVYSRYTRPAKQLLELAGSLEKAKEAIDKVSSWAISRNLDYAIETIFKKWLELGQLKPKELVKKPFFQGLPMVWSETRKRWYVIDSAGEWLEFAGKESEMEWRIIK